MVLGDKIIGMNKVNPKRHIVERQQEKKDDTTGEGRGKRRLSASIARCVSVDAKGRCAITLGAPDECVEIREPSRDTEPGVAQ